MSTDRISEYLTQFSQTRTQMLDQLRRVIVGQTEVIEQILAAIFTRGHCLLVGVPGLAKTLMVSSISQILDVSFKRIQFTPDLMPSDITGTMVLDETETGRREFRFVKGPIFANIVLADEINRTPPKTQAALLQAMQERQVTRRPGHAQAARPVLRHRHAEPDRTGRHLSAARSAARPLHVQHQGRLPRPSTRRSASSATDGKDEAVELTKVLSGKAIVNLQKLVRSVPVGDYVIDYVARPGAGHAAQGSDGAGFRQEDGRLRRRPARRPVPRATAGKAFAAMDGRFSVAIDDIKKAAIPVLRHRISTNFQAQAEGKTSEDIMQMLLKHVGDPDVGKYEKRPPK